jgi:flavin reductase (DIM6/NTAB) family NADH-FMN oxidoreductase RutF
VGVKTDSGAYKTIQAARSFALNMLGKEHKSLAFTFFRPTDVTRFTLSAGATLTTVRVATVALARTVPQVLVSQRTILAVPARRLSECPNSAARMRFCRGARSVRS